MERLVQRLGLGPDLGRVRRGGPSMGTSRTDTVDSITCLAGRYQSWILRTECRVSGGWEHGEKPQVRALRKVGWLEQGDLTL